VRSRNRRVTTASAASLTTALPACLADERVGRAGRKTPLARADDVFARKSADASSRGDFGLGDP